MPQLDKYIFILQIKNLSVFFFFIYLYVRTTIVVDICFLYKFKMKKNLELIKVFSYWNKQLFNINMFSKKKNYELYDIIQTSNMKYLKIFKELKTINILQVTKIFNFLKLFNMNNYFFSSKISNFFSLTSQQKHNSIQKHFIFKNFFKNFKVFLVNYFNLNLFLFQQEVYRYV